MQIRCKKSMHLDAQIKETHTLPTVSACHVGCSTFSTMPSGSRKLREAGSGALEDSTGPGCPRLPVDAVLAYPAPELAATAMAAAWLVAGSEKRVPLAWSPCCAPAVVAALMLPPTLCSDDGPVSQQALKGDSQFGLSET